MRARLQAGARYSGTLGDALALGRFTEPDEVAETVELLLSDRASAVKRLDAIKDKRPLWWVES